MPTSDTREISILDYLSVLRRKKFLIAAVVIVLVGLTYGYDIARTKVFRATASMQLITQNISNGAPVELSPTDIGTAIELVQGATVSAIVAKHLGVPAPACTVAEVGLTAVVDVSVSSHSRVFAARAANACVAAYIQYTATSYSALTRQREAPLLDQQIFLETEIGHIEKKIATVVSGVAAFSALNTQLQIDAAQLQQVDSSLSQLQSDATQASSGAIAVVPASSADVAVSPKPIIDAVLAGALGLLLGVGLSLLLEVADDRIRQKSQLDLVAPGLPLLGEIPKFDKWNDPTRSAVISALRPMSSAAEAYRGLRTAIQFAGFESDHTNVIQFTSPSESEGKTTTVVDLAVTMATGGMRVAVVSCDLRRPGVHTYMKVTNEKGMSSVLVGTETLEGVATVPQDFANIRCVASGPIPPNPSELLGSPRLREVLDILRATNDIVLVDSPPVLPVTDSLVISQVVDSVVIIVRLGQSHSRALARALELLSNVDAPVVGVVLNAVRKGPSYRGYKNYYGVDSAAKISREYSRSLRHGRHAVGK